MKFTKVPDVPISSLVEKNREIHLDMLTPQVANDIALVIRILNKRDSEKNISLRDREPIKIYINSMGGDVSAALTIVDAVKISETPVYTFNLGNVFKESFLVYLAGHRRYTYPSAMFMFTDTITSVEEREDNESKFFHKSLAATALRDNIRTMILDKVDLTEGQYDNHTKSEWYFTADDAIKLRIANEISKSHY